MEENKTVTELAYDYKLDNDLTKYLTHAEQLEMDLDLKKLTDHEHDIRRKYSKIAGDRLTRDEITNQIFSLVNIADKEKLVKHFRLTDGKFEYFENSPPVFEYFENSPPVYVRFDVDFKVTIANMLRKVDNHSLQTVLNILRIIELPDKKEQQ